MAGNGSRYLENGIAVWEREDIPALPETLPRREIPSYQRIMFGILPPLALLMAMLTTSVAVWGIPFKLLGEVTGLRHLRWPGPNLWRATFGRLWAKFDRWMRGASQLGNGEKERSPRWQVSMRLLVRRLRRHIRPASLRARHIRVFLLVLFFMMILFTGLLLWRTLQDDPVKTVESYYDDLDFRRFPTAYARLNPEARPRYAQYIIDLSLSGGMVASYGKLNGLEIELQECTPDHATVATTVTYVTALSYYTDTQTLELTYTDTGLANRAAAGRDPDAPGEICPAANIELSAAEGSAPAGSYNAYRT